MEKDLKRESLNNLYDVCNEIFKKYEECFYTKEELEKLKRDKSKIFL